MSRPLKQLEAEVLALSVPERAHLAQRLIESLDDNAEEDPAQVERAWEEEIRRRIEEDRAGKAPLVPASEVFAEARARLR
jgi:putative addiction module component (TIGR02574 family)